MGFGDRETCGRCSMTTVVDATEDGEADRDRFGDDRIEVDDDQLKRASPGAWLGGVVDRLDGVADRLTYGRR
ncbi:hypothetical protein Hbl1158_01670 [Halobaculum sp. CBA1158]|uniref:hypothetical protein n=1 Tax=Halobaculum sp. CBA1158 TaxID=2904243 RepID=UPI001F43A771|nr:hypothetical protein [Halobaculum sp. CBA1158]UIP00108.1 hypothetical protein Hbl1158_01670 [Halobaculum sp. CBA1158]